MVLVCCFVGCCGAVGVGGVGGCAVVIGCLCNCLIAFLLVAGVFFFRGNLYIVKGTNTYLSLTAVGCGRLYPL